MDKVERVFETLAGNRTDRPPISLWQHHPASDHRARSLAEVTLEYYRHYDTDLVKVCPFALHCVADFGAVIEYPKDGLDVPRLAKPVVRRIEDYDSLRPHDASSGFLAEMVEAVRLVERKLDGEALHLQTVFSPLLTMMYLTGNDVFSHMREDPERVHKALGLIADTTVDYIGRSLDAGATGIFFATKAASPDFLAQKEFDEFGRRYDLRTLDRARHAELLVLHLHGKSIYFEELLDYPNNVINWHDRRTPPSLTEAREKTKKTLLGGIDEAAMPAATPKEIKTQVQDAVLQVPEGLIVGPGCVIPIGTPHEKILASRRALP